MFADRNDFSFTTVAVHLLGCHSRGYGPDVQVMDKALQSVFERYTINPQQCSIGGFSDGASYALSIGTTNGELFSHIVAFSPGFMRPGYLVSQFFSMCIFARGHSHQCLVLVHDES